MNTCNSTAGEDSLNEMEVFQVKVENNAVGKDSGKVSKHAVEENVRGEGRGGGRGEEEGGGRGRRMGRVCGEEKKEERGEGKVIQTCSFKYNLYFSICAHSITNLTAEEALLHCSHHNLNVSIHDGICLCLSMSVSAILCLYQHFFLLLFYCKPTLGVDLHVESIDGGCK